MNILIFANTDCLDYTKPHNQVRIPLYENICMGADSSLLVNHPPALLDIIRNPGKTIKAILSKKYERINSFIQCKPLIIFPLSIASKCKIFRNANNFFLRKFINPFLLKTSIDILWLSHPLQICYKDLIKPNIIIYDCYDDYGRLDKSMVPAEYESLEKQFILKNVDICITTSNTLFKKISQYFPKTLYIPNAVDYNFFSKSLLIKQNPSIDKRPVVGFMGNLNNWYNYDLLTKLIDRNPEWDFVFTGGTADLKRDILDGLKLFNNVTMMGWQPYDKLPEILSYFDVAIMPYILEDVTEAISPDKMYQYLAAGIPVVSTPITEARLIDRGILIASTVEEFEKQIKIAFEQRKNADYIRSISNNMKIHTWERRSQTILTEIRSLLNKTHE